jgi:hypothetical protein
VPLRHLDRLGAPLGGQRERPEAEDYRQVREPGEFEIRLLDPASVGDSLVQVPLGVFETGGPDLRDAEADQRERVTYIADVGMLQVGALHGRE